MNERMISWNKVSYPSVPEDQLVAQNVLNNLKNWDFDIVGQYKMDKKEAEKLIPILEAYILSITSCKEADLDD